MKGVQLTNEETKELEEAEARYAFLSTIEIWVLPRTPGSGGLPITFALWFVLFDFTAPLSDLARSLACVCMSLFIMAHVT